MSYPRHAWLVLPYVRRELPGWGRLYRLVGGEREVDWKHAPARLLRDKWHGYVRRVELSNWSERRSFFLGRFYDLETQLYVRAALRKDDVFVDVGANIGMVSLLAAHAVGERGLVLAFEPNPDARARLEEAVRANTIRWVRVHPFGLSDRDEELELAVVSTHTGLGSFAPVPERDRAEISAVHTVRVQRGDGALADGLAARGDAPLFVKIDVEGFECRALRGLERTLRARRPAIAIESIEAQLVRAGASSRELFALLQDHGYRGYDLRARRRGLGHALVLDEVRVPSESRAENLAWLHPQGVHIERLRADPRVELRARDA